MLVAVGTYNIPFEMLMNAQHHDSQQIYSYFYSMCLNMLMKNQFDNN